MFRSIVLFDRTAHLGERWRRIFGHTDPHRRVSRWRRGERNADDSVHFLCCSENDNKPEFGRSSLEIDLNENVPDGYKMPLQGAMDVDEGVNGHIDYLLDCSHDEAMGNATVSRHNHCYPLFDLMVLSQSTESSTNFDQLALKYSPSLSTHRLRDRYELVIDAFNPNQRDGEREGRSSLFIHIHIRRQTNDIRFTLSDYRFVHTSSHSRLVGHVVARSSTGTENHGIRYRLIDGDDDLIVLNEVTGELSLREEPTVVATKVNPIELLVEAFDPFGEDEKRRSNVTRVKIFFRPLEQLRNVSLRFSSSSNIAQVDRSSASFFVSRTLPMDVDLVELTVHSPFFPTDPHLLLLLNHRSTFSLLPSSLNIYRLKLHRPLRSSTTYQLTIAVQHQLSQQIVANVTVELIVLDLTSSSPPTTMTTTSMRVGCRENSSWTLQRGDGEVIGRLMVVTVDSSDTDFSPSTLFVSTSISMNESELMADDCRMRLLSPSSSSSSSSSVSHLHLNESHCYQLCSASSTSLNICFNVTWIDERSSSSSSMVLDGSSRSIKPIEVAMFSFSMLFILATVTLLVIICRLQAFHLCLTLKNYLFYGKKYGLSHAQRLSTSAKITVSLSFSSLSSSLPPFRLATRPFDRRARVSLVVHRHRHAAPAFQFSFFLSRSVLLLHPSTSHGQGNHHRLIIITIIIAIVVLRPRHQPSSRSHLLNTTHHSSLRRVNCSRRRNIVV